MIPFTPVLDDGHHAREIHSNGNPGLINHKSLVMEGIQIPWGVAQPLPPSPPPPPRTSFRCLFWTLEVRSSFSFPLRTSGLNPNPTSKSKTPDSRNRQPDPQSALRNPPFFASFFFWGGGSKGTGTEPLGNKIIPPAHETVCLGVGLEPLSVCSFHRLPRATRGQPPQTHRPAFHGTPLAGCRGRANKTRKKCRALAEPKPLRDWTPRGSQGTPQV